MVRSPLWQRLKNTMYPKKTPPTKACAMESVASVKQCEKTGNSVHAARTAAPSNGSPMHAGNVEILQDDANTWEACHLELWQWDLCWSSARCASSFKRFPLEVPAHVENKDSSNFEIHTPHRSLHLRCHTQGEKGRWIESLTSAISSLEVRCGRGDCSFVVVNLYSVGYTELNVHAGLEVHGEEYSFSGRGDIGSAPPAVSSRTGITTCPPRQAPRCAFLIGECLGLTCLSKLGVKAHVASVQSYWQAKCYDFINFNCITFCREFCHELGVGEALKQLEHPTLANVFTLPQTTEVALEAAESGKDTQAKLASTVAPSLQRINTLGRQAESQQQTPGVPEQGLACAGFVEIRGQSDETWKQCCLELWTAHMTWSFAEGPQAAHDCKHYDGQFFLEPPCSVKRESVEHESASAETSRIFSIESAKTKLRVRCSVNGEVGPWILCLQAAIQTVAEKCALRQWSYVYLNVYDLRQDKRVELFNWVMNDLLQAGGAFHAGVEVYNHEFGYGGSKTSGTDPGIRVCPPRNAPGHAFRQTVCLGITHSSLETVQAQINALMPKWPANEYNLLHRNCTSFCREFCKILRVQEAPYWVDCLAHAAREHRLWQEPKKSVVVDTLVNCEVDCPNGHKSQVLTQSSV